mmetsp:Transcript_8606/g.21399  ORF Transcript_8606/g.21399 Transcript_8606/m.21399 type:complete len:284 (-) Transcript_8606:300-1151(-)
MKRCFFFLEDRTKAPTQCPISSNCLGLRFRLGAATHLRNPNPNLTPSRAKSPRCPFCTPMFAPPPRPEIRPCLKGRRPRLSLSNFAKPTPSSTSPLNFSLPMSRVTPVFKPTNNDDPSRQRLQAPDIICHHTQPQSEHAAPTLPEAFHGSTHILRPHHGSLTSFSYRSSFSPPSPLRLHHPAHSVQARNPLELPPIPHRRCHLLRAPRPGRRVSGRPAARLEAQQLPRPDGWEPRRAGSRGRGRGRAAATLAGGNGGGSGGRWDGGRCGGDGGDGGDGGRVGV